MSLAHATDPWTSQHAATLNQADRATLKDALLILLDGFGPMTGDELTTAYLAQVVTRSDWPVISDSHSVKRRLSELHTTHHVVRSAGEHRLSAYGRPALVWELAAPLDDARRIVREARR